MGRSSTKERRTLLRRKQFRMVERLGHARTWRKLGGRYKQLLHQQKTSHGAGEPQDKSTGKRAQKAKAPRRPTVLDKHPPPELPGKSSDNETSSGAEESGKPLDNETSSGAEEPQVTATKNCRQLNLESYPEAKKELDDLESFYTQEQNLRRRGLALKLETWRKAKIHFLMFWQSVVQGGSTPTLDSFLDVEKMEAFLNFVKGDGILSAGTMLTYVHHFRYVVNYIAVRDGHPTRELPISTYLTNMSSQYRQQAKKSESDKSWQVMDGKRQWIHWPEVLDVVQQCQEEFSSEKNRKKKAQLSQSLLALLMYTAITPGRSKEYSTLQYQVHTHQLPPLHASRRPDALNCLHITERGDAGFMALSDHKTSKHYGCDHIMLSSDSPLLRHLAGHVQLYRHILCGEHCHNFLFVNSRGGPYTGPKWTEFVKGIFVRYTGKAVVPSTLRSSFVTHNEKQSLTEDLKKSIASSMRHTRETALQDYDRRTRLDRNQVGHKYAEDMLKQALSGTPLGAAAQCPTGDGKGGEDGTTQAGECHKGAVPPPSSPPLPSLESAPGPSATATAEPPVPDEEEPPEPGEVVAVVHGNSTVTAPHITFGRVIKVDREHALVSTFQEVSKNTFVFRIGVGSKERVRLMDIVTPIDMVYMPTNNTYILRTGKTDIHLNKSPLL